MRRGMYKTLFIMGFLSTSSEFEITVNHPQVDAFDKFHSYVKQARSLSLISATKPSEICYAKPISLFSGRIDFTIQFKAINENQTKLLVNSSSVTVDWGKAKGMVNDIVKEIY